MKQNKPMDKKLKKKMVITHREHNEWHKKIRDTTRRTTKNMISVIKK